MPGNLIGWTADDAEEGRGDGKEDSEELELELFCFLKSYAQ